MIGRSMGNHCELVWLWSPAIPRNRGYCRKLARPYQILKKLSDVAYWIQQTTKKRNRQVAIFDRLKCCRPGVGIDPLNPPQDQMIPSELLQTNYQPLCKRRKKRKNL